MVDWAVEHTWQALVGGVLAIVLGLVATRTGLWKEIDYWRTKASAPSIEAQLDQVRSDVRHDGRRVIFERKLSLHGTDSYVVVVGDLRLDPRQSTVEEGLHATGSVRVDRDGNFFYQENPVPPQSPEADSDELRIYDVSGKRLQRKLAFQPVLTQLGTTEYEGGDKPYELHRLRAEDVDSDGRLELTGFFSYFFPAAAVPLPFIVNWDDSSRKYLVRALLPDAPAQGAPAGYRAEHFNRSYRSRAVFKDANSEQTISGYRTHAFTFFRGGGGIPRLLAAFVNGRTEPRGYPLNLQAWKLNLAADGPRFLQRCFPPDSIQLWEPPELDSVSKAAEQRLRKAWASSDGIAC